MPHFGWSGKRSACLLAWCCGSGSSPERLCGQGCEQGKAGDDSGTLEQPAEVDEPGRLAEARAIGTDLGDLGDLGATFALQSWSCLWSPRAQPV